MKEKLLALALLAKLEHSEYHELRNGYYPGRDDPWLLFVCDKGTFRMGWRMKVLHVEWTQCDADPITEEDLKWISHGPRYFHAWGWEQALVFLTRVVKQLLMETV